ncbi:Uncharacterized membrane protein [Carnobacterium alterfunditum]|uniref:Uncharacterized membrane protein n=1 Tax=Carnobacterium alterfunditum TaxID=28230 RepID=A0A1N6FVU8_9LACT|nr:DUF2254 domain-containing protein [Carnobacterium alterfunditum]SIN99340.1 Uncharacterized membrane protein [Carnobacterium alterfunditum]
MIQTLRLFFEEKRIWVTLGGSVLFSFLLAIGVILLDTRMVNLLDYSPSFLLTSVDLSKEILSLLAGSLFSVATFTFATMLSVISFYSSNFSPRTVENFLLHKTSIQTLGVFLGGFIYCLSSLFFMRSSENEYLVISASVALGYALACVVYFIKFVYNVATSIQLGTLVNKLYNEANTVMNDTINFFQEETKVNHLPDIHTLHQYPIRADRNGYVESINFNRLRALSEEYEGVLELNIRIGVFISQNEPVGTFYTNHKNGIDENNQLSGKINRTLTYETEPSIMYDPNFARQKLVEVALRAVSPGINDPNTAIHILRYKALLDAKFAAIAGRFVVLGEEKNQEITKDETLRYIGCVFYDFNNFPKDLYESNWQLIHYMKEDISGVSALFDYLLTIAYKADNEKLAYIKDYSNYLYNLTSPNFSERLDQQNIDERHQRLLAIEKGISE